VWIELNLLPKQQNTKSAATPECRNARKEEHQDCRCAKRTKEINNAVLLNRQSSRTEKPRYRKSMEHKRHLTTTRINVQAPEYTYTIELYMVEHRSGGTENP
jgi:hypothetical protein